LGSELIISKMKRILVVDDEEDICITFTNVLEDNGFVVDTFDDPGLALEDFKKDRYDLLLLDIKLKKMSGFELFRELKKIDNKAKVCFLTAGRFNSREFIDMVSELKENRFIRKPIENEELIKIINEITS
jgi:two-component system catabolic regulation response regulator CreB/two-component system response regulator ChvI